MRPDFFIAGHPKCGTTALYEMLRQHPAIFMPELKEPEFLAEDMRRKFRPPTAGPLPATLDEYLSLFATASPTQCKGEATAWYLTSHTASTSIAALNPTARVIAVFREPVSFLRSLHLQLRQNHVEDQRDLAKALSLEGQRRAGRMIPKRSYRPQVLQYLEHTKYAEQLRRYHDALGPQQILVLIYEEVKADNLGAIRRILRFLDLDDSIDVATVTANPTIGLRSQSLDAAVHRLSVGRDPVSKAVKGVVEGLVPTGARRALLRTTQQRVVRTRPKEPDEQLTDQLRRALRQQVHEFGEYIGRDLLRLWGYGDA